MTNGGNRVERCASGGVAGGLGRTVMRTIERARDAGFRVIMFYIGVEDPQIANDRIAHRMEIGGHGIDPAVVERRHGSSI